MNKKILSVLAALTLLPSIAMASPEIEINLPAHTLSLYEDGKKIDSYPVAIGKYSTPTPTGEFSIINMEVDPIWTDPETMESVESGDWNPLGYRWMGFYGRYGIHGNSNPGSIGSSVSNGCVRMYNEDVEKVFEIVDYGTPVRIIYERAFVESHDGQNVLYVYPDCYDEQELSAEDISEMIAKSGGTLSDAEIAEALEEESGEPIYLAAFVKLMFGGKEFAKAKKRGDKISVPIKTVSEVTGINVAIEGDTATAVKGTAKGEMVNGELFVSAQDVEKIMPVKVMASKDGNYHVFVIQEAPKTEAKVIKPEQVKELKEELKKEAKPNA